MKLGNGAAYAPSSIPARCPTCKKEGVFLGVGVNDVQADVPNHNTLLGIRRCPNADCKEHLFIISSLGNLVSSSPVETIDFVPENIPLQIVKTFEEAITSYANNCHVAAAIMIRRTLEEVCNDKQATGSNLVEKLKSLSQTVIMPPALTKAMDALRLLGNDAAHIEAKTYDKVGSDEVAIGLELTKAILTAIYQYDSLLGKLENLKK